MALEVVILVPLMVLLAVFVLWAGRGGRAALLADLAAEEAAVAASLCCLEDDPTLASNLEAREAMARDILAARPGLELLCIGGPRPAAGPDGADGFITENWLDFTTDGDASGVGLLSVQYSCETDGAVAPLRSTFPTVVFRGQAAEVVVLQSVPKITVVADAWVEEGETLTVTAELDSVSTDRILVRYYTAEHTPPGETPGETHAVPRLTDAATGVFSGHDYGTLLGGEVAGWMVIPPGQTEGTALIATFEDHLFERDETFSVKFELFVAPGEPPPAVLLTEEIVVEITNDDDPPVLEFAAADLSGEEGTDLAFAVELAASGDDAFGSGLPARVRVDFIDDLNGEGETARYGVDFSTDPVGKSGFDLTFGPGHRAAGIVVTTIEDMVGEDDETFRVRLSAPVDAELAGASRELFAVGTIIDDEPKVTVDDTCSDARLGTEADFIKACATEGSNVEFVIMLDAPVPYGSDPVIVDVRTAEAIAAEPGTEPQSLPASDAGSNADFTAVTSTLTFAPPAIPGQLGDQVKTVSVPTVSDALHEGIRELFYLVLDPVGHVYIHDDDLYSFGAIIDDDDAPTITLSGPAVTPPGPPGWVDEGALVPFVAALDAPSGREVWVDRHTDDGTAIGGEACGQPGVDYESIPSSDPVRTVFEVTDGASAQTVTIEVPSCADGVDEAELETLELVLTNALGAELDPALATTVGGTTTLSAEAAIRDNDEARLSVAPADTYEGNSMEFTLTLSAATETAVTVDFATEAPAGAGERAATEGDDYDDPVGVSTVEFKIGEIEKQLAIPTVDDHLDEHDEVFNLVLSNPVGAILDPLQAIEVGGSTTLSVTGTILDNDPMPGLKMGPVQDRVLEGDALVFEALLTSASGRTVWFDHDIETIPGEATTGADFEWPPPGGRTLKFDPGVVQVLINILTYADGIPEGDEQLTLFPILRTDLDDRPSHAHLQGNQKVDGTITDIVGVPKASVTYPTDSAGDPLPVPEGSDLVFTVELNPLSTDDVFVKFWTTREGTAEEGEDYVYNDQDLRFPAGQSTWTVPVRTRANTDGAEAEIETVVVMIEESGFNWADLDIGDDVAVGAIFDGDVGVGFQQLGPGETFTAEEGSAVLAVVELEKEIGVDVTLDFYTRQRAHAIHPAIGGAAGDAGADYEAVPYTDPRTVTIPAGTRSVTVPVQTFDDDIDEETETFVMWLKAPDAGTLPQGVSITDEVTLAEITDGDESPSVSVTGPAAAITEADGAEIVFTVSLDRPSDRGRLEVGYLVTGMSAVEGLDYEMSDPVASAGRLIFEPGQTETTVTLAVKDDFVPEPDEVVRLLLFGPRPADHLSLDLAQTYAEATITDNDLGVRLSGPQVTVTEGDEVALALFLDKAAPQNMTVEFYTFELSGAHSATPDLDFVAVAEPPAGQPQTPDGQVHIPAGATEATIRVQTIEDQLHESDEAFLVRLLIPQTNPAVIAAGAARSVLIEDDEPELEVSVTGPADAVTEGGTAAFTVALNGASSHAVTVDVVTVNGSAAAPGDFYSVNRQVTLQPGDTTLTVDVDTIDDTVPEDDETFTLELRNPQSSVMVALAADSVASATITDNDQAVRLVEAALSVVEGEAVSLTVELKEPAAGPVEVHFYTHLLSGDNAASDLDIQYNSAIVSRVARFAQGDTEQTIEIKTIEDDIHEGDEVFQVRLLTPQPDPTLIVTDGVAKITIRDDEDPPEVSVTVPRDVDEGDQALFWLRLDHPSKQDIVVDYRTEDGTAVGSGASPDYVPQTSSATIGAGLRGVPRFVTTLDDSVPEGNENFEIVVTDAGPDATIATSRASATIVDNDFGVSLVEEEVRATEGGVMTFTVRLTSPAPEAVSVEYYTLLLSDETAASATDFDPVPKAAPGLVQIAAGGTQATIEIQTHDDDRYEGDEAFQLRLLTPSPTPSWSWSTGSQRPRSSMTRIRPRCRSPAPAT